MKEGFATGTVKSFDAEKGFGFITPEGGGTDLFVHISGVQGNGIKESDTVDFDIVSGPKGPAAINVQGGSGFHSAPAPALAPVQLSVPPPLPLPQLPVSPSPLIIQTPPTNAIAPAKPAPAPAKPAPSLAKAPAAKPAAAKPGAKPVAAKPGAKPAPAKPGAKPGAKNK